MPLVPPAEAKGPAEAPEEKARRRKRASVATPPAHPGGLPPAVILDEVKSEGGLDRARLFEKAERRARHCLVVSRRYQQSRLAILEDVRNAAC